MAARRGEDDGALGGGMKRFLILMPGGRRRGGVGRRCVLSEGDGMSRVSLQGRKVIDCF
jgi:hypothetical protein